MKWEKNEINKRRVVKPTDKIKNNHNYNFVNVGKTYIFYTNNANIITTLVLWSLNEVSTHYK